MEYPNQHAAPKKKHGCLIAVLCFVVLLLATVSTLYFARAPLRYYAGQQLYQAGLYEEAETLFSIDPDYADSKSYIVQCRSARGTQLMKEERYIAAIEIFESYDGGQELAQQCYYLLAEDALAEKQPDQAIEYFTQAGDYSDAVSRKRDVLYQRGHELFLNEEYALAETYLTQLDGVYPEEGGPHFVEFADALEYLHELPMTYDTEDTVYVGNVPEDYQWDGALNGLLQQHMGYQFATVTWYGREHEITVKPSYYPGQRIIRAWKTGNRSDLSVEEQRVYDKALSLAEQALSETEDIIAAEQWLHDWLCEHVEYSSPNMNVSNEEYIQLRELTCVGALMDGVANCQGYTDAFYVLATMAGLEVGKLFGVVEEGHCWNTVTLDGKTYFVDVTNDDALGNEPDDRTYFLFNSPWDPEFFVIHEDPAYLPTFVTGEDFSQSYYGQEECVFDDLDDAVYYLMRKHKKDGEGWTYAVVTDTDVTSKAFYKAVKNNARRAKLYSVRWRELFISYNGDTYLNIYWE